MPPNASLSGVARIHGRFGLGMALRLLRGVADERLERMGFQDLSTFGILSDRSEGWLRRLLRRLITAGWVSFTGGDRPMLVLTASGRTKLPINSARKGGSKEASVMEYLG